MKNDPVILDLTRKALEDSVLAREPCLLTLGVPCKSVTDADVPSLLLVESKLLLEGLDGRASGPRKKIRQNY